VNFSVSPDTNLPAGTLTTSRERAGHTELRVSHAQVQREVKLWFPVGVWGFLFTELFPKEILVSCFCTFRWYS
jgi:hypothetical protein